MPLISLMPAGRKDRRSRLTIDAGATIRRHVAWSLFR